MHAIRHTILILSLSAAAAFAAGAAAQDAAPASEPAVAAEQPLGSAGASPATPPAMGMGMGPGMGMRHGAPHGEHCQSRMHGMGAGKPGMHGGHQCSCRMAGGGMADQRIDELEKRLDLMQAALEMLLRQQAAGQ